MLRVQTRLILRVLSSSCSNSQLGTEKENNTLYIALYNILQMTEQKKVGGRESAIYFNNGIEKVLPEQD